MTQIIAFQATSGIVVATDSRAVVVGENGESELRVVNKVFRLTPHVAMVAGGAGKGLLVCQRYQKHVADKGLIDFEEILFTGVAFLRAELAALARDPAYKPTRPELERLYILIAGHDPGNPERPYRIVMLGSDHLDDPLRIIPVTHALAIPRQMALEYRLARTDPETANLPALETNFEKTLTRMSKESENVAPPFHFIRITERGASLRTVGKVNHS